MDRRYSTSERQSLMNCCSRKVYVLSRTLLLGSLCPRDLKEAGSAKNVSINFSSLSQLKISLSRLQTFVGLAAGILSITGGLASFLKPAPDKAVLMAIVQDAKTAKAVSDATIEILTT